MKKFDEILKSRLSNDGTLIVMSTFPAPTIPKSYTEPLLAWWDEEKPKQLERGLVESSGSYRMNSADFRGY